MSFWLYNGRQTRKVPVARRVGGRPDGARSLDWSHAAQHEDAKRRRPPLLHSSQPARAAVQGGQSRSLRPATQWWPQQSREIRACNLFSGHGLLRCCSRTRLHSAASTRWLKLANGSRNDHAAAHRPSSRVAAFATTFVLLSAIARSITAASSSACRQSARAAAMREPTAAAATALAAATTTAALAAATRTAASNAA